MKARAVALLLSAVVAVGVAAALPPVAQDPAYHRFADQRAWRGLPNAADVLSNAPFLFVGALGLLRARSAATVLLFLGVLATGVGSAVYHARPENATLVWDRAPIAVTCMALLSLLIGARLDARVGEGLLLPLVAFAVGSVAWWAHTEALGRGDLRAYGLAQYYPGLAAVILLWPPALRSPIERAVWPALGCFVLAKLAEHVDAAVFAAGGVVSGHSLKHLFAAAATACLLRLVR